MEEDRFFDALYHVMWDLEIDIFSEGERTCGVLSDLVPKCRKERRRLKTMYECHAMKYIEKAVANPENSEVYLNKAVKRLVDEADMSSDKALQAVNSVAALWDSFPQLESYNEENYDNESGGEDKMLFLNDVPVEENTEEPQQENPPQDAPAEGGDSGGGEEAPEEPKESLVKNLIVSWCKGDNEDGRPYMIACPIGWIMIIFSSFLGAFMVKDITYGDKFVIPAFVFTFAVLTSKRLYRYDSTARFSLLLSAFYLIAVFRSLWDGTQAINYLCVPLMIVAFIVFNNGRISSWLDESKKKSVVAYLIICVFSAVITVGAYAIQTISL